MHRVVTPDGYILEVHRIISSPYREYSPRKPAVFLQHGFLDSSATWVMSGQNHGLGMHNFSLKKSGVLQYFFFLNTHFNFKRICHFLSTAYALADAGYE